MFRQPHYRLYVLALMAVSATASLVSASGHAPTRITFQAYVVDDAGTPDTADDVPYNGNYGLTFSLYNTSAVGAGTAKWTESYASYPISDGQLILELGSATALDASLFNEPLFLEIAVDSTTLDSRVPFNTVPYAFTVADLEGAGGGSIIGGLSLLETVGGLPLIKIDPADTAGGAIEFSKDGGGGAAIGTLRLTGYWEGGGLISVNNSLGGGTLRFYGQDGTDPADIGGRIDLWDGSRRTGLLDTFEEPEGGSVLHLYNHAGVGTMVIDADDATAGSDGGQIDLFNGNGTTTNMNTVRIDGSDAESGYASQGLVGLFDANGSPAIRLQSQTVGLGPEISMFRDTPSVETVELIAAETANEGARVQLRDVDGTTTIDFDAHTSSSGSKIALSTSGGTNTLLLDSNASGGPEIRLGTSTSPKILLDASDSENGYAGASVIAISDEGGHPAIRLHATGIPGTDATPWTSSGKISLFKDDGVETVRIVGSDGDSTGQGGQVTLYDGGNQRTVEIDSAEGSGGGAFVQLRNADGKVTIELDADYGGSGGPGRVITQELEITGGSDLSEQFEIAASGGKPLPGQVVSIDPDRPGQLRVSARAYDRTVAGVISGAGGIRPGMLMGQRQSIADGAHPVALTGRVWCLCDASSGAVEPGDLLTTAARPGHAMKVVDYPRAQGAIIGKAMTSLKEGQGLVLVLVNLQ